MTVRVFVPADSSALSATPAGAASFIIATYDAPAKKNPTNQA